MQLQHIIQVDKKYENQHLILQKFRIAQVN